jgi:hypothetical protein
LYPPNITGISGQGDEMDVAWGNRNSCGALVRIIRKKILFRTPRRGWEDNIKMDLKEI